MTRHELFWNKVLKSDTCWLWTASGVKGYGQFWDGERLVLAHRFGYELFQGRIPKGLTIDHLCKVKKCVRWDHLEVVPLKVNILRGDGVTARNKRKTACPLGHKYKLRPPYGRYCPECRNEWQRKNSLKKRTHATI